MIDFVVEQWFALLSVGLIVSLWIVARDRRKTVDRLVAHIDHVDDVNSIRTVIRCRPDDAISRVIARSVKRVTKEKRQ